jgi:hypothetical protein
MILGSELRRRDIILSALATAAVCSSTPTRVSAQFITFDLTLRRDHSLPTTLHLSDCILGKLYQGASSLSDPGSFICDTLELPFRNELEEISCVKPGSYSAFVKTDPTAEGVDLGWRLQLQNTKQLAIQIHTGNTTDNTRGCILVGTRANSSPCELTGGTSVPAREQLRSRYGNNNQRPVRLVVLN